MTIHFLVNPFKFVFFPGSFHVRYQLHFRGIPRLLYILLILRLLLFEALPSPVPLPQHVLLKSHTGDKVELKILLQILKVSHLQYYTMFSTCNLQHLGVENLIYLLMLEKGLPSLLCNHWWRVNTLQLRLYTGRQCVCV